MMDSAQISALLDAESRAVDLGDALPTHHHIQEIRRVAIFTEAFLPKVDGVSRTALLTIRYLQNTGRQVIVFAPSPALPRIGDAQVISIPSLWLPSYPETRAALPYMVLPLIRRQLEQFRPDIIHLFSPAILGAIGMLMGASLGVPIIANYQTDLPGYTRSYSAPHLRGILIGGLRFVHNGCHLTLAPSPATLHELRGWRYRRLHLWGRGVDSDRFNPARRLTPEGIAWRARLLNGRDPSRLVALYVGRMAREKHLETLRALAKEPGIALTLIGGGQHASEVRRALSADGADTHFIGHLLGDDLANAFSAADFFVFPGPEETFGQVVLEAMASGLPVIVTDRGGPATLVRPGENGFVVPVDDSIAFRDRARELRDNPGFRTHLAQSARQYAVDLSWVGIMAQLEQYYDRALKIHRRHRKMPHLRTRQVPRHLAGWLFLGVIVPLLLGMLAVWIASAALLQRIRPGRSR